MSPTTATRSIMIGVTVVCGLLLVTGFFQRAPDIMVAWGNAWAEHERREAAEDIRHAEAKKVALAERKANEDYNEAHCKVTIDAELFRSSEVVTNVRSVSREHGVTYLYFGGGVVRSTTQSIIKTENCR